ncbi:hypothetical protein CLV33_10418 [Jejuia pallidilutea]|uniref:Uncharacterized protein n=1 Tax=Jejuia pallidilutea TaxID=504487 RepID=A0A362XCH1_9FLAO|nr:hypothetical protein [Jejuia pallidilutea]PQV48813.1 hypothetical protein CLV33_10418 [Jejuia pallidilutea]
MKSTRQKKTKNQEGFVPKRISKPEMIVGGGGGPIIDKDKIRTPKRR